MVKHRNIAAVKWPIHWKDASPAEATWEGAYEIKFRFPELLVDKEIRHQIGLTLMALVTEI